MYYLYPDSILFLHHGAFQPARRQIAPLNLDQRKPVITVEHHEIHPVNRTVRHAERNLSCPTADHPRSLVLIEQRRKPRL